MPIDNDQIAEIRRLIELRRQALTGEPAPEEEEQIKQRLQALGREVLHSPHVDCAPVGGAGALVDGVFSVFDQPRSTAGFAAARTSA